MGKGAVDDEERLNDLPGRVCLVLLLLGGVYGRVWPAAVVGG